MTNRIKLFIFFATLLIVFVLAYFIYAMFFYSSNKTYFLVEKNTTISAIASDLKKQSFINNITIFKLALKFNKKAAINAGSYSFDANSNTWRIAQALLNGKAANNDTKITIVEGWNINDIASHLAKNNIVDPELFLASAKTNKWSGQYEFLQGDNKSLEGFLFPDTYMFAPGSSPETIIKKMLDNFDQKAWQEIRNQVTVSKISDIITLASIVEKEAKFPDDKKMVADIFLKRLEVGMPLQSDATISYVSGKNRARATYNDLALESAYNTYKYKGLPPGPICSPGLNSILAVINPSKNNYYYFVTDKEGRAHYGITFEEHQKNISNYLD